MTDEYYACDSLHRNMSVNVSHRVFTSCDLTTDPGCFAELLPSGIPLKQVSQYLTTKNGTDTDLEHYKQFLETCDPATDPDCPGVVINGRPLKKMYELRPFHNDSFRSNNPCHTFLILGNRSLVLPDEIADQSPRPLIDNKVREICESRWTIPSDNLAPVATSVATVSLTSFQSPVGSLYCSIPSIFGARC